MCGSATLTMVASSTTISCAVAITASASPSRRGGPASVSAAPVWREVADKTFPSSRFRWFLFRTYGCVSTLRRRLRTGISARPVAVQHLLEQPEEGLPFRVADREALVFSWGDFLHRPLFRGDAFRGDHRFLPPPVSLAGLPLGKP